MNRRIYRFVTLLAIILLPGFLFSLEKDKVFEQLRLRFSGLNSLKLQFTILNKGLSGSLLVASPNKFRLELMKDKQLDRIIISNGQNLWNYSPKEKQVVLSTPNTSEQLDLQNVFADFEKIFVPISLSKENNSQLGSNLTLLLGVKNEPNQKVKLYLDNKLQIKAVGFANGSENLLYRIQRLQLNVPIKTITFEFKPPKDVEVIDLR